MEVILDKHKGKALFIVVIDELPKGFVRNNSSLKFFCKKYNEMNPSDPLVEKDVINFFGDITKKMNEILDKNKDFIIKETKEGFIISFIYKENFKKDYIKNFDKLSENIGNARLN